MASGTVKGITISFRGDTTQLSKAINQMRGEAKGLDKELGYINNSLKFNPKNVDLLKQRLAILKESTSKSKDDIKDLKKALDEMKSKNIDETNEDYRELQREIIKAESRQKAFNKEIKKLEASTSTLGQASQKMADFGNATTKAGESLRGLSMVAGAVDVALAGLTLKAGQSADDLNTMSKVTGVSTEELQKYKYSADLLDVSVDTITKSQIRMKKSMLSAQQGSSNMAEAFATLGVNIEDSNGQLRSQDEVFAESIKALGQMENETQRDALAMQIFGKSASELNPLIEDNGETFQRVADIFAKNGLEVVDQETIDKANQFQDALDTLKATGMVALSNIGMQLAGYLAPAMEKIADVLGRVFGWISQLDPKVLAIIGIIAGVIAVVSPLLIFIGKLATGISAIMSLVSTLAPIIAGLGTGALLPIIGIIGAVIGIGVLLYKNWDTIKEYAGIVKDWVVEKWTALKDGVVNAIASVKEKVLYYWEALKLGMSIILNAVSTTVTNVWNGIKNAITNPIQTAVDFVKKAIEKIKGFFSGLKIELPHIKLPHFKLNGSFSLVPPSVPKISIDWYKNGGIFTNPTIFPTSGVGVGEAGAEAVLPLKKLWEEMDKRFDSGVVINVNASPGMDVNALALEIERRLIASQKRRREAWA